MTNSPAAAAASPTAAPAAEADDRTLFGWLGPLIATVVTLPLTYYAHIIVILGAAGAEDTGGMPADVPVGVFRFGLLVPLCLLSVAWTLSGSRREANRRILYSFFAPVSVLLLAWAALILAG